MKITFENYNSVGSLVFYKATASGVQICFDAGSYRPNPEDGQYVRGYIVDSLFVRLRDSHPADFSHLNNSQQGFFTTEEEAIAFHRELVINYIRGLNASSLKTCPINVEPHQSIDAVRDVQ